MMTADGLKGKLKLGNITVHTGSGNVTMANEGAVIVNKSSGAATTVTLTPDPKRGDTVWVIDGKGDAATNNITITPPASGTINGSTTLTLASAYGGVLLHYNGTQWNVVAIYGGSVSGLSAADLVLNSVNEMNITIGGVSVLALDDAAITGNAGAANTVGLDVYIETQDGGATTGNTVGKVGGKYSLKTGDGSAGSGTATTGGAGGDLVEVTGAGAAPGTATGTAGRGGDFTVTTGAGGATTGAGTGGRGGDIVITPGAGGTTVAGTDGRSGVCNIADGKAIVVGAVGVPGTYGGGNWIGLEDSGTDPSGTYTNSLAIYTPDGGDSLDFLHADGTTDSLGT